MLSCQSISYIASIVKYYIFDFRRHQIAAILLHLYSNYPTQKYFILYTILTGLAAGINRGILATMLSGSSVAWACGSTRTSIQSNTGLSGSSLPFMPGG